MIQFIKITLAVPKLIAPAKRLLEKREVNFRDFSNISYAAFESNIDFEIRFMADTKVVGCNWIELPPKKHLIRKESSEQELFNPNLFRNLESKHFRTHFGSHKPVLCGNMQRLLLPLF